MATTNVEKIKDAELRKTMSSAHKALKEGDFEPLSAAFLEQFEEERELFG